LLKKYVRRKFNNAPGVNLRQNFAFTSTPSFSLGEISNSVTGQQSTLREEKTHIDSREAFCLRMLH